MVPQLDEVRGRKPRMARYALGQLGRVVPVTSRCMFGGFAIYVEGLFFA
jgi:TfoX/Sxy family transcriptional regulator of competence genes